MSDVAPRREAGGWAEGRHAARALALGVLFEMEFQRTEAEPAAILARRVAEEPAPEPVVAYAEGLARGAWAHRREYDALIARLAPTWPIEQMARVDRNILRLALYEMFETPEVPVRAAINEAVELAKQYGSEASRRFINGVLGTVAAEYVQGRGAAPPADRKPGPRGAPAAPARDVAPEEA